MLTRNRLRAEQRCKKMKLKNIEIVQLLNGIAELSSNEMPVRLAYAIKKNHKKLVEEYRDYEEQLNKLREKHDEKSMEYGKELKELLDIEVNIEFHKIPESVFENGDFAISPKHIEALEFMIE